MLNIQLTFSSYAVVGNFNGVHRRVVMYSIRSRKWQHSLSLRFMNWPARTLTFKLLKLNELCTAIAKLNTIALAREQNSRKTTAIYNTYSSQFERKKI